MPLTLTAYPSPQASRVAPIEAYKTLYTQAEVVVRGFFTLGLIAVLDIVTSILKTASFRESFPCQNMRHQRASRRKPPYNLCADNIVKLRRPVYDKM